MCIKIHAHINISYHIYRDVDRFTTRIFLLNRNQLLYDSNNALSVVSDKTSRITIHI